MIQLNDLSSFVTQTFTLLQLFTSQICRSWGDKQQKFDHFTLLRRKNPTNKVFGMKWDSFGTKAFSETLLRFYFHVVVLSTMFLVENKELMQIQHKC